MEIRSGTREDFDAVAALGGNVEFLRARWQQPSFDPTRHLWLADGAFGALYAPNEAVVRGDAARVPALLEQIEQRARAQHLSQLTFVIPAWDEPAWRAYEAFGFELATEVLELEIAFDEPPRETPAPDGIVIRTYTDDDAHRVRELLDDAYLAWDETYAPLAHEDWLAFMTDNESFVPECWFVAEKATSSSASASRGRRAGSRISPSQPARVAAGSASRSCGTRSHVSTSAACAASG